MLIYFIWYQTLHLPHIYYFMPEKSPHLFAGYQITKPVSLIKLTILVEFLVTHRTGQGYVIMARSLTIVFSNWYFVNVILR